MFEKLQNRIDGCEECGNFETRFNRPFGMAKSEIVFIVNAPDKETENNMPLDSKAGKHFRVIIYAGTGFKIKEKALVVPITFCATKMKSKCVATCREIFVNKLVSQAKILCIVGKKVYKTWFNDGPIPELLYGRSIEEEQAIPKRTLFFFTDYEELAKDDVENGERYWTNRITLEAKAFGTLLQKKGML